MECGWRAFAASLPGFNAFGKQLHLQGSSSEFNKEETEDGGGEHEAPEGHREGVVEKERFIDEDHHGLPGAGRVEKHPIYL